MIEDAKLMIVVNNPEAIIESYVREELGITKYDELAVTFDPDGFAIVTDGLATVTAPDSNEPEQLNLPLEDPDKETDPPFLPDAAAVDTEGFFKN